MDTARGRRTTTLKDVARLADVSIATASKAINDRRDVHPDTRARVLAAAEKLSFTPNSLARGLLVGRTGTIGLLTNDLVGRFSLPILMGAEDAAGTGKMSVLLCDARSDPIRESYHLKSLLGRRVDGLIVVGSETNPRESLGQLPVPTVYVYSPSLDPHDYSLVPDDAGAAATVVRHLVDLGRTRIAHITGESGYTAAADRTRGAVAALTEAGLPLIGGAAFYGSWTEAWGRSAAAAVLDSHPDVDAIMCGSDQIARGVLDCLRERGHAVPQSIVVTGFDNWEILATGSRPQLTSVDMELERLGHRAARYIFAALSASRTRTNQDDGPTGIERFACRLVVRGSTVIDS